MRDLKMKRARSEMKEGATSQGSQGSSRRWRRQEAILHKEP